MSDSIFDTVKVLTELPGPIGYEQPVHEYLERRWARRAERCWTSRVGNLYAHVGGEGRTVLIGGHADEICLLVKSITPDGFLHLSMWNADREGRPPRWLFPVGQTARIVGPQREISGVFATSTGHVLSAAQRDKPRLDWGDVYVDIGARSSDEVAALGVRVGHRVIWNPSTRRLGQTLITGKAMDDRAALAIMTILLEEIDLQELTCSLYFVSTVMEETGLEGAHSIMRDLDDIEEAIALDVGLSGDVPSVDFQHMPVRLGGGPVLVHQDSEIHYNRQITDRLIAVADSASIPIQHAVFQNYASDGAAFIRQGVPSALIAFATRYTHSPFETLDESDLRAIVDLLKAYVTAPS
jgi:tetrahedral aminopeptidase